MTGVGHSLDIKITSCLSMYEGFTWRYRLTEYRRQKTEEVQSVKSSTFTIAIIFDFIRLEEEVILGWFGGRLGKRSEVTSG